MNVEEYYISYIDLDLYEVNEYRVNLKNFFIIEIKKNVLLPIQFKRILEELERIAIQVHELENKKSIILKLNEK
jgi:hypothetical protein